jgi:hypothetical protein
MEWKKHNKNGNKFLAKKKCMNQNTKIRCENWDELALFLWRGTSSHVHKIKIIIKVPIKRTFSELRCI